MNQDTNLSNREPLKARICTEERCVESEDPTLHEGNLSPGGKSSRINQPKSWDTDKVDSRIVPCANEFPFQSGYLEESRGPKRSFLPATSRSFAPLTNVNTIPIGRDRGFNRRSEPAEDESVTPATGKSITLDRDSVLPEHITTSEGVPNPKTYQPDRSLIYNKGKSVSRKQSISFEDMPIHHPRPGRNGPPPNKKDHTKQKKDHGKKQHHQQQQHQHQHQHQHQQHQHNQQHQQHQQNQQNQQHHQQQSKKEPEIIIDDPPKFDINDVGPHPGFIEPCRAYVFEHRIQECLKKLGTEMKDENWRISGVNFISQMMKTLGL
jgi:hypothetical protein